MTHYTPGELMVAAAAREIRDGEMVFVGMRLPLIAFMLAKRTWAPGAVGVFEAGLVRDRPAAELLYTMADPPNIVGAAWATGSYPGAASATGSYPGTSCAPSSDTVCPSPPW